VFVFGLGVGLLVGARFMVLQWVRIRGLCVGVSVFGGRFMFARGLWLGLSG